MGICRNCKHMIRCVDLHIFERTDNAGILIRSIVIGDRRILREAIGAIRLLDMRIDILLIRRRAEEARRERRLRLLRDGRRIDSGRIGIAALSARRVERDVLDALRCRRRRKTLGDGRLAHEIALAAHIRRVVELFRKGIQCCADEIFVCRFLRLRIEADAVRQHRDLAVCRRFLDGGRAAVDRRRRCSVVAVAHGRIAAELFDFEIAGLADSLLLNGRGTRLHGRTAQAVA